MTQTTSGSNEILLVNVSLKGSSYSQSHVEYVAKLNNFRSQIEGIGLKANWPEEEEAREGKTYYSLPTLEVIADAGQLIEMMTSGFDVSIKSRYPIKTTDAYLANVAQAAEAILAKLAALESGIFPEQTYNQKCDVHVPGIGLLAINRTMLLEDVCTDELNTAIQNGWRIIAACPQPSQRRPDYILGKYDPDWNPVDYQSASRRADDN